MRASSAVLTDTSIRLWDLGFPRNRVLLARTRSAYVHLDNLILYSKRDRDGRVDAYVAAYLPDEVVLLFFVAGELANAAILTTAGRLQASISEALRHARAEPERSEICFHTATPELLAAMYATCAQNPQALPLDTRSRDGVFNPLVANRWSGVLELISNGRVNYLTVQEGRFQTGIFSDQRPGEPPTEYVSRLFGVLGEARPMVSAKMFQALPRLPLQAPPAMLAMFRKYVWDLGELAEREMPREGLKRAERVRMRLVASYDLLRSVGGQRGAEFADPIAEPTALADAIASWTREYLGELEVMHPQIAPRLAREAGRENRFALSALGFFERLPWRIQW